VWTPEGGQTVSLDHNLFLGYDCTVPRTACYSNEECSSSRPFCKNRGTSYASCEWCRGDFDCAHLVNTPFCYQDRGYCTAENIAPHYNGNPNAYAIGNTDPSRGFVFFARSNERECCSDTVPGILYEGSIESPSWITFDLLPTLQDPIKIGRMGVRKWSQSGTWDGLWDMGFVISAVNSGDYRALDKGDVYTFVNAGTADICSRKYPKEWLPGAEPTIWPGAVAVESAGSATLNQQIYWESPQYFGAYMVRVYWDCTVPQVCSRTVTVVNTGNATLNQLTLLMSWNFDITPTPGYDALYMSNPTPGPTFSYAPIRSSFLDLLTPDGQVPLFSQSGVPPSDFCAPFTTVNQGYAPTSIPYYQYCDSGAAFTIQYPVLLPGNAYAVTTEFAVFDTASLFQAYYNPLRVAQYWVAAGTHVDGGAAVGPFVTTALTNAFGFTPGPTPPADQSGSKRGSVGGNTQVIPGDCPCYGNATCSIGGIHTPCICDATHYGTLCEYTCGTKGYWDPVATECFCFPGWYKDGNGECNLPCHCNRGSHCDPSNGGCFCKNGLTGPNCDQVFTCR